MLRYLIEQNNKKTLKEITPDEINLISDLISGQPPKVNLQV